MNREVLQMALDYVERHAVIDGIPVRDAIKAALAQQDVETALQAVSDFGQLQEQTHSQNPKFTMDEWAAHARKHQWRFDEEPVTGVTTIAQPEQEPVAWMHKIDCDPDNRNDFMAYYKRTPGYCIPLYASPPQRQEDPEPWLLESTQTLAKTLAREFYPEVTQWECLNDLAGVISQIDNMTTGLMRKTEQEPVAWLRADGMKAMEDDEKKSWVEAKRTELVAEYNIPLYTSTSKCDWVGLTDNEISKLKSDADIHSKLGDWKRYFARAIEAKLKEKNK